MSPIRTVLLSASLLVLTACEPAQQRAGNDPIRQGAPVTGSGEMAMEFRGRRPCVDCDAIETWLLLERRGDQQRYELVERYFGERGERRFDDRGEWAADDDVLRLTSAEGGERVYARMPDASLQARASDGGPLAAASDDVMVPTDMATR